MDKFTVKYGGTTLQDTFDYDIQKIFEDLFLLVDDAKNRLLEGIQSEALCKIRSRSGDKTLRARTPKIV